MLTRSLAIMEVLRIWHLQVFPYTCLTQGHLVSHTKRVNHLIVFVTVKDSSLLHLGHGCGLRRLAILMVWWYLSMVHVLWHVLVMHTRLTLATPASDLPIVCCLVHIVTHLYLFS